MEETMNTEKALILVDLQKEWEDVNSKYYVGELDDFVSNINKLIDFCKRKGYKIIFTKHVEEDEETKEFKGANTELLPNLKKDDSDQIITKNSISPFFNTNLDELLENTGEIVVAGLLTNLGVRSSVQDGYDRGMDVCVIKDCCTTLDRMSHEFTIIDLEETREDIDFLDLEDFMKED